MWNLKKRLWPKKSMSLPAAKINHQGKLISKPQDIKNTLRKEYSERLRKRPKHPQINKFFKTETLEYKLSAAKENISPEFTLKELENVLKKTKNGKARDPDGLVREIFKTDVIGEDLKVSLLTMLNQIKKDGIFPDFMKKANISTISKKNKSRLILKNERGIFIVNTVRGILMRILFNRKSQMLDSNMSYSNIGGRKDKSCINPIWVVNGIIHEQLSSINNPPIVIQQYDYSQMFDGMELKESLSDLYNSGVQDDTLHLIYEANKNVAVRVKTSYGLTEELHLEEVVLQGEVWGPSLAANQVDTFGKEMLNENYSLQVQVQRVCTCTCTRPNQQCNQCHLGWLQSCTTEQLHKCEDSK